MENRGRTIRAKSELKSTWIIILRGSSSTFRTNPHQLIKDGIICICAHTPYQNETKTGVWQDNCSEHVHALGLECTPDAYGVATSSSWDCLGSSDTFVRTGCAHGWWNKKEWRAEKKEKLREISGKGNSRRGPCVLCRYYQCLSFRFFLVLYLHNHISVASSSFLWMISQAHAWSLSLIMISPFQKTGSFVTCKVRPASFLEPLELLGFLLYC